MAYRGNSQEDKRESFAVYEDDADSLRSRFKQPEIASKGKVQTVAGLKNATAAKFRCVTGEQPESIASGQQVWDNYIPHSITASRTCNEGKLSFLSICIVACLNLHSDILCYNLLIRMEKSSPGSHAVCENTSYSSVRTSVIVNQIGSVV